MKGRVTEVSREDTYFGVSTDEMNFTWPMITVCPITVRVLNSATVHSMETILDEIQAAKKTYK